ncbi:MAG: SGNH/GDSL hydrolase family protein [Myxococcales bacterium]|jgi:lysophospholipase L1-like esterase|nr:SGNH/GDSL hydrolase family protein [Myxococcales bacterium]
MYWQTTVYFFGALLLLACASCHPQGTQRPPSEAAVVRTVIVGDAAETDALSPRDALPQWRPTSRLRDANDAVSSGGVCRFDTDEASGGETIDGAATDGAFGEPAPDGLRAVAPQHPHIRYWGRVDCTAQPGPAFAYPAVSIRAVFTGAALDVLLRVDTADEGPQSGHYFDVIIDDAPPTLLRVTPGETRYSLARGLSAGPHTLEIVKRNESSYRGIENYGKVHFLGLHISADGALLPVPPRAVRLEFIGDSITCGYGNERAVPDPTRAHHTTLHSNAAAAWGALTARALDADYMAVAYSGRGVARNYGGDSSATFPNIYARTLPDEPSSPRFDSASFAPDLLVVNLGTNDYSEGLTPETFGALRREFVQAYTAFLTTLRENYPQTPFVLAVGPMMSDAYPPGLNAWTAIQADVAEIRQQRLVAGDENIYLLVLPPQTPPFGEDWHPAPHTHHDMALQLLRLIQQHELLP